MSVTLALAQEKQQIETLEPRTQYHLKTQRANTNRMKSIVNFRPTMIAILSAIMLSLVFAAGRANATTQTPVGEITLLLGKVRLAGKDGTEREAALKSHIYSGDSIGTQTGGHLHIKFIDGGMISVRPGSQLQIEDYSQHAPAAGKTGSIKFKLEHGVMRSITGQWGETARDRFRLNTPFAAIGVKGTDFVVQTTENDLRLMVHSGAVVLSRFGESCRIDSLGPCKGETSRELSAEMGPLMLNLQRHRTIPQILPQSGFPDDSTHRSAVERPTPKADGPLDVLALNNSDSTLLLITPPTAQPNPPTDQPTPPTVAPAPAPASLIWGRWDRVVQRPDDVLTVSLKEAAAQERTRVSENDYYALYRLPESSGLPSNAQGKVSFGIESAQAHLVSLSGVQAAKVESGQLMLDFTARQFNTGLNLNSIPTGPVQLQASGAILPDGTFSSGTIKTRVKGAVTTDLKDAAYLFEQATQQGMLTGIVNWR